MKAIVCEMCGSQYLVKQDGMYVCQSCGTKYSTEEAKKLMVDVSGSTVKIDTSQELENLYLLARRAKNDNNSENAQKYYEQILVKDPSSWEANFYSVYFQSMNIKIYEIQSAAIRLTNCEDTVLKLIKENVTDKTESYNAVDQVGGALIRIGQMLHNSAMNHYNGIDINIQSKYVQELVDRVSAVYDMAYHYGDLIISIFGDDYGKIAAAMWKFGIGGHNSVMKFFTNKEGNKQVIISYSNKIKKYEPTYQMPSLNTSGGCYVATAVYGSYDCPEVWTLRRYRDDTLALTWYGRAFIHTYYAVSPTLVRWFGNTNWFKNMWKPKLDRMVNHLNDEGVSDKPYNDKKW